MTPPRRSLEELPLEPPLPGPEDGLPDPHTALSEALDFDHEIPDPQPDPETDPDTDPKED